MSRIEIKIPEVGQTTSEVTLVRWHKSIGAQVQRGDVMADLETDKMVVEMESFAQGTLVELLAGEGSTVADINIGLAVSAPQGLVLPALRQADGLSLTEIARARRALVKRVRDGKADATQPTFTISNLGMHGIIRFVAIIPPKQAAILAVGAIQKRLVLERDTVRNASFMSLTLSLDHRFADGAEGAQFLSCIRELLEGQVSSLLHLQSRSR